MSGEAERAAERLIQLAGSKRRAHELIDAAQAKGDRGRRLSYREIDQRLIANAVSLEGCWRRLGATPPKRFELIKRQVEACWRNDGTGRDGNRSGKWDQSTCGFLLLGSVRSGTPSVDTAALEVAFADALARWENAGPAERLALENAPLPVDPPNLTFDLGTNPGAVTRRIRERRELRVEFSDENSIASWSFDAPKGSGQGSFWNGSQCAFGMSLAPESWLMLHLQRPELGLLPHDVKWGDI
jgi:hypothetical protein